MSFHREYLVRLPLPLAQLYSRAHNAKDARGRHDNTFYLLEALVKLTVAPLVAAYLAEVSRGGKRSPALDRLLAQLSLPSFGQWTAILRELARHFGDPAYAATHPLGHLWQQLSAPRKDLSGALALYRRIKNGPDGQPAGDQSVTLLALLDSLVQYRNAVFGHGGPRFGSFYEQELGPLLFPAADELLAEETCQWWGPKGTRLVYLTELRGLDEQRFELGLKELIGLQAERSAPIEVPAAQAASMAPHRMAILWPGHGLPVPLDPLLVYRETELSEEVLFLNRELQGRQVQYLSYTTGRTERDKTMGDAMARLLSQITGREISSDDLERLQEQSVAETPSVEALFEPTTSKGRIVGDYEILTQIGRGGMGVVYLARQLSLGRIVALKMLPADLAGDEVALARFRREMRALARCDHPHIVKVLASGTLPDGQLYYAMEYVPGADLEHVWRELAKSNGEGNVSTLGGTTWASAVLSASRKQREQTTRAGSGDSTGGGKESAAPPSPQSSPEGRGNAEAVLPPLPELPNATDDPGNYTKRVALLIRDAALSLQAVHEQQIIHRDVKPANLMLTPDGQRVVLMDFGLAKGDSMSLTASKAGGFLGTLRYAAPEQLASATINIGPPADIRGLGVVLWELLTRKRLFADAEDERQLAQWIFDHDVPPLRCIDATFDRDLEAIVARATERRVSDRIATASDLANYLQLYVDGQPLPIRPPGLGELTRRWVRQHAGLVATGALAAAVIVVTTVVAFAMINRAKNEAISARDNAQRSEADAVAARDDAKQNAAAADRQRNLAIDTLNTLVYDVQDQIGGTPALHQLKQKILDTALKGLETISDSMKHVESTNTRADHLTAMAQLKISSVMMTLGSTKKAGELVEAALNILQRLADQTPNDPEAQNDLATACHKLGQISRRQGNGAAAKKYYERALVADELAAKAEPTNIEYQRSLAIGYSRIGDILGQEGNLPAAADSHQKSLEISQRLLAADPANLTLANDLTFSCGKLAAILCQQGKTAAAKPYLQKCLELRQKLHEEYPENVDVTSRLTTVYDMLASIDDQEGNLVGARKTYEVSLKLREQAAQLDPLNTEAQSDLVVSYDSLAGVCIREGNLAGAKAYYQKALEIGQRLAANDPANAEHQRNVTLVYSRLADVAAREGNLSLAKKYYGQSLETLERMAQADPTDVSIQLALSQRLSQLAGIHAQQGDPQAAIGFSQRALQIAERLSAADPSNADCLRNRAIRCENLGDIYADQGELQQAERYYQQDLEILQRLADGDPSSANAQRSLSIIFNKMGGLQDRRGNSAGARQYYEKGLQIRERLAKADPANKQAQVDVAASCQYLVDVLLPLGDYAAARQCAQRSLEIHEQLSAADTTNQWSQRDLAFAYNKLADVLAAEKNWAQARQYYERGLDIRKKLAEADPSDIQAQRRVSRNYSYLADVCTDEGDRVAAQKYYQQSQDIVRELLKKDPENLDFNRDLTTSLDSMCSLAIEDDRLDDAARYAQEALDATARLAKKDATNTQLQRDISCYFNRLGDISSKKEELTTARDYYQKALDIRERLAGLSPTDVQAQIDVGRDRYNLGTIFAKEKNWQEALREHTAALDCYQKLTDAGRLPAPSLEMLETIQKEIDACRTALSGQTRPSGPVNEPQQAQH